MPFENVGWDRNFIASGTLSPHRFKKPSEKAHLLRKDIKQYLSEDVSLSSTVSAFPSSSSLRTNDDKFRIQIENLICNKLGKATKTW